MVNKFSIKIFKPLLLFFLLKIILTSSLSAQILNVEKSRQEEDSLKRIIGNINISFALNNRSATPNEKIIYVGLAGYSNLVYLSKKHAYILIGQINYNAVTGNPFISTGYGHFRINFHRKRKLSYETYTQLQYDESRGMNYRVLGGAGVRLNLVKTKNTAINLGLGAMWEAEEWIMPENADSLVVKNLPKSSNYISLKLKLNPHTDFNLINYYQVGYDNEQDVFRHRLSVDVNLVFTINKYLSFTNTFNAAYENRPIVPINRFIYSLSNGFLIKF